jgi:uncharacterized protein YabN with tetrapyrrole methylase and pyrophosphatase domain
MSGDAGSDVYVVGLGMVGYAQVTREAEGVLENAGSIYLLSDDSLVTEFCEGFDAEVVHLSEEYTENERRVAIYERMADRVLQRAESAAEPVVLAVYGHPLVGVSPTKFVIARAPERDVTVHVKPGISSLDSLYVDLEVDPLRNGMQVYEATDFLLREFDPTPDVPLFLLQIGLLETGLYSTAESAPGRFDRMKEYLLERYPASHELQLVKTATYPVADSEITTFELGEFGTVADDIDIAHTLYVPPVRTRPVRNEQLAKKIDTEEYLSTITK